MVCDPDYFHKVWRDAADGVERRVVILKNDNYESENNIEYGIHEMQLVIFSNVQKLEDQKKIFRFSYKVGVARRLLLPR